MNFRLRKQIFGRILLTISLAFIAFFSIFELALEGNGKPSRVPRSNGSLIFLDNLLESEADVPRDSSIFFVDTTRMRHPKKSRDLTLRQICSVESAARANPNARVFLTIVAPDKLPTSLRNLPRMHALLGYPNVRLRAMHLLQFAIDSPLEQFMADGRIFESKFVKSHTSDALRLLLLWKFGGTYLDADMIVRRDFSRFPGNFVCRDGGFLCGAIIKLTGRRGRHFAETLIEDFVANFSPKEWGANGPLLLGRVLSKLCNGSDVRDMHECRGFHVMNDSLCYPVTGVSWRRLFDEKASEPVLKSVNDSMVVHFWNKLSRDEKLRCDSRAAYTVLARHFCPRTMEHCVDFF